MNISVKHANMSNETAQNINFHIHMTKSIEPADGATRVKQPEDQWSCKRSPDIWG